MAKKKAKKSSAKPRRAAKKAAKPKTTKTAKPSVGGKKLVGEVSHFFDKISVGVVEVKSDIKVGDTISIEGPQTNFKQKVGSMQVEHSPITTAKKGQSVGMKVAGTARKKDLVYKLA